MNTPNQFSDKQIVNGILEGNDSIVDFFFYKECKHIFRNWTIQYLRNIMEVDDFTNEFYVKLCQNDYKNLKTFNFSGTLKAWVNVCSRNLAYYISNRKENKLTDYLDDDTLKKNEPEYAAEVDQIILKTQVLYVLSQLKNEKYRMVIEMFFLKELDPEEISKIMNIKVANFYNIKLRALIALAALMRKEENNDK